MSEKILDIKEERLSFFTPAGEVKALNGVSFTMNQGDVLGIVGESGSGKSVTAYSVMGLTAYPGKLVGGTVWFNGHEIEKMKEKDFRKIRGNEVSIIFQDPMTSLNPVYTIGNQIVEVIRLHTKKNKAGSLGTRRGAAGAGRHQRAGKAPEAVPPRAVRRYAPARDDRHRPGL